jgi:serine/threonine protein kinase
MPQLPGWVVERPIAAGGQAEVFLVRRGVRRGENDEDTPPCAAKVLRIGYDRGTPYPVEEQQWRLRREVAALRALAQAGCPNVPRVLACGTRLAGSGALARPWYVMPYYAGGVLWQASAEAPCGGRWAEPYVGNIDRVLEIAEALATTLAVLHDGPRRVLHRDVSAGNVLFAAPGGTPILADFGMAHVDGGPARPAPRDGAPAGWSIPWVWPPPELDAGDGYTMGPEADIFMFGALVYGALSGGRYLPPAREWDGASIHTRPEYTLRRHTVDPRVAAVEALLDRMLTRDPAHRLPAREVARTCQMIRARPAESRPHAPATMEGRTS